MPRRSPHSGMNFDMVASTFVIAGRDMTPEPPPRLPRTGLVMVLPRAGGAKAAGLKYRPAGTFAIGFPTTLTRAPTSGVRSEERRVGKECRSRWSPYH